MITDHLPPKKARLLTALVCDSDVLAACETAGVSRTTAYRWLDQAEFKAALARQRDAVLSGALESIKTQSAQAVTELSKLLSVKDDRLRRLVCNDILTHAMRIRELDDFEKRLVALEKAQTSKGKGGEA